MEAVRIRDESSQHHLGSDAYAALGDLELSPTHVGYQEEYYLGFASQEYMLNKSDWKPENLFRLAADVNLSFDNLKPRDIDDKEHPVALDRMYVENLVQEGLENLKKLELTLSTPG